LESGSTQEQRGYCRDQPNAIGACEDALSRTLASHHPGSGMHHAASATKLRSNSVVALFEIIRKI
jgi:hypothetical protein